MKIIEEISVSDVQRGEATYREYLESRERFLTAVIAEHKRDDQSPESAQQARQGLPVFEELLAANSRELAAERHNQNTSRDGLPVAGTEQ
ncbi:hypothetical protein PQI66_08065 [Corynebacterium sp. USCH3]|uniref:hypothetical protein n=1 Tax=Corynebacterium sp. USCH3 TaxID=3024840 RepID=UPI0030B08E3B